MLNKILQQYKFLPRDEAQRKDGGKPTTDQTCVFEDLNSATDNEADTGDELNAQKNDFDKVDEDDRETGKKEAATLDDDKEEILISGVLEKEARKEIDVERDETEVEEMKETAVDRTGDISEYPQQEVDDLKEAGSKVLEVVKEKVEALTAEKERDKKGDEVKEVMLENLEDGKNEKEMGFDGSAGVAHSD